MTACSAEAGGRMEGRVRVMELFMIGLVVMWLAALLWFTRDGGDGPYRPA